MLLEPNPYARPRSEEPLGSPPSPPSSPSLRQVLLSFLLVFPHEAAPRGLLLRSPP